MARAGKPQTNKKIGTQKWHSIAMFSALILGTIIVIVVTAIIGISPIGELAFQESATMGWANATVWNTYASMGSSITLLIVVPIILLALFLLVALTKTES